MATCTTNFMKGIFLLFNLVFWVTGLALLVVGVVAKFWFGYMIKLSTEIDYNLAPYITIGVGVFIVLVGFAGCWGALKEHTWALKMYMGILGVLFIAEIVGVATGYFMQSKMKTGLQQGIGNAVRDYYHDEDSRDAMDQVQSNLKCCGLITYKDYFNKTVNATQVKESVPKTCCKDPKDAYCPYKNMQGVTNLTAIYTEGCYNVLIHDVEKNLVIIAGILGGIVVFQLLGIASASVVSKKIAPEPLYERV